VKTPLLVKRLWELGYKPRSYFPVNNHGRPVVSVQGVKLPEGLVTLPDGWVLDTDTFYWPFHEWQKEYGKEPENG
jgi:nitrogen fixation protein